MNKQLPLLAAGNTVATGRKEHDSFVAVDRGLLRAANGGEDSANQRYGRFSHRVFQDNGSPIVCNRAPTHEWVGHPTP